MFAMIPLLFLLIVAPKNVVNMKVEKSFDSFQIPRYISSLVSQLDTFDPSQYHDVAMFRLEQTSESTVF